jgi:hypothetical protein
MYFIIFTLKLKNEERQDGKAIKIKIKAGVIVHINSINVP